MRRQNHISMNVNFSIELFGTEYSISFASIRPKTKFKSIWAYQVDDKNCLITIYDQVPDKPLTWENTIYIGRFRINRQGQTEYGKQWSETL